MSTMIETSALLGWLSDPRSDREIRFADEGNGWRRHSYDEVAARTHSAGLQLREAGVRRGEVVAIVLPTGVDFVAAFYGTLVVGATPCPVSPPTYFSEPSAYRRHLGRAIRLVGASVAVTDDDLIGVTHQAIAEEDSTAAPLLADFGPDRGRLEVGALPEIALMQLTSGTTGDASAARVTADNLETHIRMAGEWQGYDGTQTAAVWLPLYHDMGLVGCLMTSVAYQGDVYWMRPDQFVRKPVRWLECFGRHGASITAAPTFAFSYASKRVDDDELVGMDFSGWEVAVMGAERVDAGSLHSFAERFVAYGFHESTFTPAYGLAEATLAVTGVEVDEIPSVARVDWRTMRSGQPLSIDLGCLDTAARSGRPGAWLVGCGRPRGDLRVTVVGDNDEPLPAGHLGEIVVEGSTVVDGYEGRSECATPLRDGRLYTADAGFFTDGDLYVLGRMGDMLTVRGRNVYVEDLEARLTDVAGLPRGRFSIIAGGDEVVALVETPTGPWVEEVAKLLVRYVCEQYALTIVSAPRGSIERTSSGKPRRRPMWQAYQAGELPGEVAATTREDRAPVARP